MNKKLAMNVMEELKAISDSFNHLTELSYEIPDIEEQKAFRKALGKMYAQLYTDIIMQIEYKFPELKLDNECIGK